MVVDGRGKLAVVEEEEGNGGFAETTIVTTISAAADESKLIGVEVVSRFWGGELVFNADYSCSKLSESLLKVGQRYRR